MTIGFYSCDQHEQSITTNTIPSFIVEIPDSVELDTSKIKEEGFSFDSYIHTEADYTDSAGKGIIIQNSYPRGGGTIYMTQDTQLYGHAVFWTRIINQSDQPLSFNIHFPADSFLIYPSPDAHFKLLVPQDVMRLDRVTAFSFGFDNVKGFVESNFYQPSELKRTIPANGETMFYVVLLSHLSKSGQGASRTGLFLKGENLYYRLISSKGIKLLPCGWIDFEE